MNFLNIRVVVNDKDIYFLQKNKAVLIPVAANNSMIVATDGFHITKPLELSYQRPATYYLRIVCAIDDNLMWTGILLMVMFAFVGLISNLPLLQYLSLVPVFYFLFFYYINRKEFIQIRSSS